MNKIILPTVLISTFVSAIIAVGVTFLMANSGNKIPKQGDGASAYVKQALLNDPAMLEDVFTALQSLREQQQTINEQKVIENARPALFSDPRDAVLGNPEAAFTMVEFFDYNCGYCKVAAKWTRQLLADNPDDVHIIFKDFPVLEGRAPGSEEASRASMAAWQQGAEIFAEFHFSMMENDGGFDSDRIDQIAQASGVDVGKMRADMLENEIKFTDHINQTMVLARSLNIDGTPAFVANDILVHGANTDMLQQIFDQSQTES